MVREEPINVPQDSNQANPTGNDQDTEHLLSPRFKSIAAIAGWDEEALLVASLIVEDTPDRACKHKKHSDSDLKSSSSRKRGTPSQDEDAALALRLQREEFIRNFRRRSNEQSRQVSLSLARANLRAMASRAISIRSTRGQ